MAQAKGHKMVDDRRESLEKERDMEKGGGVKIGGRGEK